MKEHEELRVRHLFFEYFCQILRHIKVGIKSPSTTKSQRPGGRGAGEGAANIRLNSKSVSSQIDMKFDVTLFINTYAQKGCS